MRRRPPISTRRYTLFPYTTLFRSRTTRSCWRSGARCSRTATSMASRSEEHTSELQSRNDISYAVFCLKKKKTFAWPCCGRFDSGRRNLVYRHRCYHHLVAHVYLVGIRSVFFFFFFNDTATTEIYTSLHTLSLHDALPI